MESKSEDKRRLDKARQKKTGVARAGVDFG